MSVPLSHEERALLKDALMSAFSVDQLEQLVYFRMGVDLHNVVGGNSGDAIFGNFVRWAEQQGRAEELLRNARTEIPGNVALREFEKQYRLRRNPDSVIRTPNISTQVRDDLVETLLRLPQLASFEERSRLVEDLPATELDRNRLNTRKDIELLVDYVAQLGRNDDTGVRPLCLLIEKAHERTGTWDSGLRERFTDILRQLDDLYAGEPHQEPTSQLPQLEALAFEGEDSRLAVSFFEQAILTGKSVARLQIPRVLDGRHRPGDHCFGTGWIVAPGILITNYHVINARMRTHEPRATPADLAEQCARVSVWFDYYREGGSRLECRGTKLLLGDANLDFALLELDEAEKVADRRPLPLMSNTSTLGATTRLNIVQHSGGGPQQYAVRNNFYIQRHSSSFIRYITDTQPGASGSPVLDDNWHVVALHHAALKVARATLRTIDLPAKKVEKYHNEGVDIQAILNFLSAELRQRIENGQRGREQTSTPLDAQ